MPKIRHTPGLILATKVDALRSKMRTLPQPRAWLVAALAGLMIALLVETTSPTNHPTPRALEHSHFEGRQPTLNPSLEAAREARREARREAYHAAREQNDPFLGSLSSPPDLQIETGPNP